jgi:predicted AAA+ superfamily ATPase
MWINREIESTLTQIATKRPALILTGSRQSGKTSLLTHAFQSHRYISLDVPIVAEEAENSGSDFIVKFKPPLILDEIQYAPTFLRYIKADIENHREQNGRFLITGSQKFALMKDISESLAGRCAIVELHSLSAREYELWSGKIIERETLVEWMYKGGYPELHAAGLDPQRFYADYTATYLERDVRSLLQVRNLRDFDRFLRICASRTGQLLSLSSLAADVGVSLPTIRSWISVLEASNIIFLLEPYYKNLGKRIVKTPKLYFLDTGLACYLCGLRKPLDLSQSSLLGPMFETHVLGQIIRHYANQGRREQIYFYRDHEGHEIDFLLPHGDRFQLVECKWVETPSVNQRGFEEFRKLMNLDRIISQTVVTQARGHRRLANGITVSDSIDPSFLE